MGFDIYGLDPNLTSQRPTIDWDTATEKDKEVYFKALDEFEDANPGYYFLMINIGKRYMHKKVGTIPTRLLKQMLRNLSTLHDTLVVFKSVN